MQPIQARVFFEAPIERVFETVSHHEQFFTGGRIESRRVIQPGGEEKNGLGTLREVKAASVRYVEGLTAFEQPNRLAYQIRECNRPIRPPCVGGGNSSKSTPPSPSTKTPSGTSRTHVTPCANTPHSRYLARVPLHVPGQAAPQLASASSVARLSLTATTPSPPAVSAGTPTRAPPPAPPRPHVARAHATARLPRDSVRPAPRV